MTDMTTIGAIADIFDGPHATPNKTEDGPYFLNIASLQSGRLVLADSAHLTAEDFERWTKRVTPRENDLLFSYETRLGEAALMPSGIKACLGRRMGLLRPKLDKIDPQFLLYSYLGPHFQHEIVANTIKGATVERISISEIGNFKIRVPSKSEQQKIAAVLSALDAKIDLNNRINAEMEALAKTIYDYWFVQFDFPDAHGRPYQSSGGAMVWNDTLKREIPVGWKAQPLSELGSFRNGINYDPSIGGDSVARIVNVRNVSATSIFLKSDDLDELKFDQADIDKYLVTADSILIARSGIPGATRMMQPCPANTIYCGFIICLKVANAENKLLLFFRLKQLEQSLLSQSSGSILKNVSQDTLKDISLAVPRERSVIEKFNAAIEPLFEKISANNLENIELTQLRDWLLPLLMNGQVRVA